MNKKLMLFLALAVVVLGTWPVFADVTIKVNGTQVGRFEELNLPAGTSATRTAGSSALNLGFPSGIASSTAIATTTNPTMVATLGNLFTYTPTQSATVSITGSTAGQPIYIVETSGAVTSYTTTFGTGFKSAGTMTSATVVGNVKTITFISDGTNVNEIGRVLNSGTGM